MWGVVIGDIVGSTFEAENHRSPFFELFRKNARFTDDTVCTAAIADTLDVYYTKEFNSDNISNNLRLWCCTYLNRGFGSMFQQWIANAINKPYNSYGNGALMRVSPVALYAIKNKLSKEEAFKIAEDVTKITHNHPDALLAVKIYIDLLYELLSKKLNISQQKELIINTLDNYNYERPKTILYYRINIDFDLTCKTSLHVALAAILETDNFEDVLYQVVSVGGDSDTYAAIAGGIAESMYGVPKYMNEEIQQYFKEYDQDILKSIEKLY